MLWNLNPSLLRPHFYEMMRFPDQVYPEDDSEQAAVLAFHCLHVIMAQFATVYGNWLRGSSTTLEIQTSMADIFDQLECWHCSLPLALQLFGDDFFTTGSPRRSSLHSTLLIHYLSTKLFAMHTIDPSCTNPVNPKFELCRQLALQICSLINGLGPPESRNSAAFRGDVGVILPLSVASMFVTSDDERAWICQWARRANHEGMWCGRRRGMIVEAWARYEREYSSVLRPFYTMVGQGNIFWRPGDGLNVCIMTYNPVLDERSSVQLYMDDQPTASAKV